eukprot:GEMP01011756.1.p1 GENE.GEMP01011756.1~~GEMP01011756.1.p1  ORF type:complete len:656 (+),score=133.88 GEMP01011756.1:47-1969(+)
MRKARSVPFLPGQSSIRNHIPGENPFYYRKCTMQWNSGARIDKYRDNVSYYQDEVNAMVTSMLDPCWRMDVSKAGLTHEERRAQQVAQHKEKIALRLKPAWMKHDRQVLRFQCYMQESVIESSLENRRFRYCTLLFYLEDGTLQIDEPKVENCGIPMQGSFTKRHCVPKADDSGVISIEDLKCGEDIEIYGKKFRIVSCDPFTRWYYEQIGLDAGVEESAMEDNFQTKMRIQKAYTAGEFGIPSNIVVGKEYNAKMLGGGQCNSKIEQFLKNDLRVLRFYCYWDDKSRYGDRLFSVMHFFLSDNTVEFTEVYQKNSGRQIFPVYYKRSLLAKCPKLTCAPGFLIPEPAYYALTDFAIGNTVVVYGRQFFLYACDEFTKQFYKQHMNLDLVDIKLEQPPVKKVELNYPPHTSFGSEEDSLASCISLRPKPPAKDLVKIMALSNKILRFVSSCSTGMSEDADRRFIVAFFLEDDTCSIFEARTRNSGFMEGLFCERTRAKNPTTGKWFAPQDFYVGAQITVNAMKFNLLRPDEYSLKYMEEKSHQFPQSDINIVLKKIKDSIPEQAQTHPDKLLQRIHESGIDFTDQEMITIVRRFGSPDSSTIDLDAIRVFLGVAGVPEPPPKDSSPESPTETLQLTKKST